MKFSLVLATVGRISELVRFLQSLEAQAYRNFELIVVDQSSDDRLVPIVERYKQKFAIVHLRSAPGLSRARNVGLRYVSGDIVAFPDDDCWYPPDLLERVVETFGRHKEIGGILGRTVDTLGRPSLNMHWLALSGELNLLKILFFNSNTIFLRHSFIESVGPFDEILGVGAGTPWGAGEETDYLIRGVKKGFSLWYSPEVVVFHEESLGDAKRSYRYGCGFGMVLRKHGMYKEFAILFTRTFLGVLLYRVNGRKDEAVLRWFNLLGRWKGFWGFCE